MKMKARWSSLDVGGDRFETKFGEMTNSSNFGNFEKLGIWRQILERFFLQVYREGKSRASGGTVDIGWNMVGDE